MEQQHKTVETIISRQWCKKCLITQVSGKLDGGGSSEKLWMGLAFYSDRTVERFLMCSSLWWFRVYWCAVFLIERWNDFCLSFAHFKRLVPALFLRPQRKSQLAPLKWKAFQKLDDCLLIDQEPMKGPQFHTTPQCGGWSSAIGDQRCYKALSSYIVFHTNSFMYDCKSALLAP